MAYTFNLLPPELVTGKEVARAVNIMKTIAIFAVLLFAVLAAVGVTSVLYYQNQFTALSEQHDSLKTTVQSMEATEQGLVLVKDRTQKIQQILDSRTNEIVLGKHKEIVDTLPEGVTFRETDIDRDKASLDISSTGAGPVSELMTRLTQSEKYKKLVLDAISFNALFGYVLSLEIN
jgi:Tfp pilus assembly protein PilN